MIETRRHVLAGIASLTFTSFAGCTFWSSDELSENEELALVVYGEGDYVYHLGKESLSDGFYESRNGEFDAAHDAFDEARGHFVDAYSAFREVNEILAEEDTPVDVVDEANELAEQLRSLAEDSKLVVESIRQDPDLDRDDTELKQFEDTFEEGGDWSIISPEELEETLEQL